MLSKFFSLSYIICTLLHRSEMKDGQYVFNIPSVANNIRMQASELLNHLQNLKVSII